jgi:hypothetical protein
MHTRLHEWEKMPFVSSHNSREKSAWAKHKNKNKNHWLFLSKWSGAVGMNI